METPAADLEAVLTIVGEVHHADDQPAFAAALLDVLAQVLPVVSVSYNEVDAAGRPGLALIVPELPAWAHAVWGRLAHQNPLLQHFQRTRDARAKRMLDVVSREQLHALELHRELYARLGIEDQLAILLPAPTGSVVAVVLNDEQPFTDVARDTLERARPHLVQAHRNATFRAHLAAAAGVDRVPDLTALEALGLSRRQAQVLQELIAGRSTAQIAETLALSPRTVHAHLRLVFGRLGVHDRVAAVAVARARAGAGAGG